MLKKIAVFHFLPIGIALLLFSSLILLTKRENEDKVSNEIISGEQKNLSGKAGNLNKRQDEIDFLASLKNPDQLTIFGSSEFSNSPNCPYYFFPDSLGIPMFGLGHAYHQHLSILIELLAGNSYLNSNSKVCIIISPGWFTKDGTNTEAFVEFAIPSLLKKIISDSLIEPKYKNVIGEYISIHHDDFTSMNMEMLFLQDYFKSQSTTFPSNKINTILGKLKSNLPGSNYAQISNLSYDIQLRPKMTSKPWNGDFKQYASQLQVKELEGMTNNPFYVNNEYYSKHLFKDNKEYEPWSVPGPKEPNREFMDFKMVVSYLKHKNVQASFVFIPLNPYGYNDLDINLSLIDSISQVLADSNYPLLNMYAATKAEYDPGILKDIMHLSDFGWMRVNEFIYQTYYENKN
ncbi:MAG: D-alanyl-lipoteichoic acid biosynthesis protein DltD [Crocinitomicaceae bacterium]